MNVRLPALRNLTLLQQFSILIGMVTLGFAFYGAISVATLRELQVNGPVYRQIVQGKDLIADILPPPEYIIESYLVSMEIDRAVTPGEIDALAERLRSLQRDYDGRHAFWQRQQLSDAIRSALLDKAHNQARKFYEIAFDEFLPAIRRNDRNAAKAAFAAMTAAYRLHRSHVDSTVQLANQLNDKTESQAGETIRTAYLSLAAIFLLSLAGAVGFVIKMTANLRSQLGGEIHELVAIAQNIAAGNISGKDPDTHH